jgi:hypothetical protein
MAPDDHDRLRLLRRLEEVLGPEEAAILMTNLPPERWTELATRRDLDAITSRFDIVDRRFDAVAARFDGLDQRFEAIGYRFDGLRSELIATIDGAFRRQLWAMLALMIALATLVLATAEVVR